ncbi:hypothetical protein ABTF50_20605, partial [Acinetobacter baumannii]
SLVHDLQKPNVYYVGSDVSHLLMGVVMFIMTVAPMALMAPGTSMAGMTMPICHGSSGSSGMSDMHGMDMPSMNMSH